MKNIFTIGVFYLAMVAAIAQDQTTTVGNINPDSLENYFSIGCGRGGSPSASYMYYKKLIAKQDYNTIRKNLLSGVPVVSLLSALTLEHLSDAGKLKLSKEEKQQIKTLKSSKEKIQVCIGCTYHQDLSMSSLFLENDSNRASVSFTNWLDTELKTD